MKYYVYIDNFRGFSDACIPILDVNFLVGENSTGKTSFLGLLKLLSGPNLFFGKRFDDEHIGFGGFSDMVSAHSSDRSYFRIGFVWEQMSEKKEKSVVTGCLLTYVEEKGLPQLSQCTFSRNGNTISLRLGKDIHYREDKCAAGKPEELISLLRTEWVRHHADKERKYIKLAVPPSIRRGMPILVALSFILDRSKQSVRDDEISIFPPDIDFVPELTWLAPIRTKTKRTYDQLSQESFSPEGAHTPYLIRRILRTPTQKSAIRLRNFFANVGKTSGLFQDVQIKPYGRGANAPFELDIVLDGKALNVNSVGYGVSQALPVLVEVILRNPDTWFAIQQPEVHLHPRAQAALGDVFFELAVTDKKHFLIETHSDFTVDRFRLNYVKSKGVKPSGQILFFERKEKHNTITPLVIGKTGELPPDQPESYRQFFIREQLNLLNI
jgi:hypothetical protein